MLENSKHGSNIPDSRNTSVRKTWLKFLRSLFFDTNKVQGGLQDVGESRVSGGLDEKILQDVQQSDKIEFMQEKVQKSRDDVFSSSQFEWVKTERAGELCRFSGFEIDNGVEYTNFDDGTRIRTDFIVDIGPGAGEHGGRIIGHGNLQDILNNKDSITGQYLSGVKTIDSPKKRRKQDMGFLELRTASGNNLKNVNQKY